MLHAKNNQKMISIEVENPDYTDNPSEFTASPSDKLSKFDAKNEEFKMIYCQVN